MISETRNNTLCTLTPEECNRCLLGGSVRRVHSMRQGSTRRRLQAPWYGFKAWTTNHVGARLGPLHVLLARVVFVNTKVVIDHRSMC
jgi:hypothetical protein